MTGAVDYEREEFRNTTPGGFAFNGRRSTENWGFVGQYEGTIDDALSLGASIRRDENTRFDDTTTYRLQAGYRLPFGLRARGAYGTGVKNPGYFELYGFSDGRYIGNPNLKPEKSKGWEAGIDQEFADGKGTIGATYFDSKLEDEIFTTSTFDTGSGMFLTTGANRTTESKQHGVETFVSVRPIPQIKFDLAYTYLKAREKRDRGGAPSPPRRQPEHDRLQHRSALFGNADRPLQRASERCHVHRSNLCDLAGRVVAGICAG